MLPNERNVIAKRANKYLRYLRMDVTHSERGESLISVMIAGALLLGVGAYAARSLNSVVKVGQNDSAKANSPFFEYVMKEHLFHIITNHHDTVYNEIDSKGQRVGCRQAGRLLYDIKAQADAYLAPTTSQGVADARDFELTLGVLPSAPAELIGSDTRISQAYSRCLLQQSIDNNKRLSLNGRSSFYFCVGLSSALDPNARRDQLNGVTTQRTSLNFAEVRVSHHDFFTNKPLVCDDLSEQSGVGVAGRGAIVEYAFYAASGFGSDPKTRSFHVNSGRFYTSRLALIANNPNDDLNSQSRQERASTFDRKISTGQKSR